MKEIGFFNLFKKKKTNNEYPSYLQHGNYGNPKWSTQKDEQFITEGFNKIVWIYTCATLIASNVSKVTWELYRKGSKDRQIFDHPILKIVNSNINSHFSSKDFFELWALSLALQGKFYAKLNNSMYPTQLYTLYPHKVKPIPNEIKFVEGFEYDAGQSKQIFKDDEVLWSKFNNPLDYYEGMSPIKAASRTVDTENSAVDWNKSALDNNGIPAGAIQVQNPSPEVIETLRKEWKKRYAGANNARVPIILNSEKANYIPFGLNQVDMDYINLKLNNRIEICAVFKVPPQVAGDTQAQTFANYEQAMKSFWEQCIIPDYLDRMKDDLNLYISSKYADNLELRYNLDDISALHESTDAKMTRAVEGYKNGILTRNEARFLIDHDDVDEGDEFIDSAKEETIEEGTVEQGTVEQENSNDSKQAYADCNTKALNMTDEEKKAYWHKQEKEKEDYARATTKLLQEVFEKERKQVIKAIEEGKKYKLLSDEKQRILIALYKTTIDDFGTQTYNKLKKTIKASYEFNFDDEINKYIAEQTATQVVLIDETTVTQIQQRIKLAQAEGLSNYKVAKLVDDLYLDKIIPNRSEAIARTETNSSSNFGSLKGAKQAESDFDLNVKKIWIATYDARVRPTHAVAGGHDPIRLNDYFQVGVSRMQYPCDYMGGADECVRCRCALGYTSE